MPSHLDMYPHSVHMSVSVSGRIVEVWQGVAMDSLKFHLSPPCPTILNPAGEPPLKQRYSHFRGGLPAGVTRGSFLPLWIPHVVCLWVEWPQEGGNSNEITW
jgi:hypothetical protein